MTLLPTVELPRTLERVLAEGHPWVYRDHVPATFRAPAGSFVRLRAGGFSAYGLWDADSPIAIRIYSEKGVPDAGWIGDRVRAAWALRKKLGVLEATTAFRWIAGEGDGLPGVVVDRYAGFAVIVLDSDALEPLVPWLVQALSDTTHLDGILRRHRDPARGRLVAIGGREPPPIVVVEEHGIRFGVDLRSGQKTGLFLDQRENRRCVETYARDARVLNLFAYTGGFSLYAARGGARHVTTVDLASEAIAAARDNFELNGIDPNAHAFVVGDAFDFLADAQREGHTFDVVVCDPPSFARQRKKLDRALAGYTRLHTAGLRVTRTGGLYAAGSCTARVSPASFHEVLARAARGARRECRVVHEAGHAADHPVRVGHPEGRYLKFVVLAA